MLLLSSVFCRQGLPGTLPKVNPQELISGCDHDMSSSTASEVLSPPRYMPSMLPQDSGEVKVGGKDVPDKSVSFSASLKKKGECIALCYCDTVTVLWCTNVIESQRNISVHSSVHRPRAINLSL